MKKRVPIAAALLLACLLAAGGCGETTDTPQTQGETVPQVVSADWEPVSTANSGQEEACFALSPEEFLRRYNALCQGGEEECLPALDQWMDYGVGQAAYASGAAGHQYTAPTEADFYAGPLLALCTAEEGGQVIEVVTGLSQKNYGASSGDPFQTMTFRVLRAFWPDLDQEGFDQLYEELFVGGTYAEAGQEVLPVRVFHQEGAACYATLQIGEYDQIHVRAVSQEQLDWWQSVGVEVVQGIPGLPEGQ